MAITRAIDELYIIEEDQENFIIAGIENFVERTQDFSNNVEATNSIQVIVNFNELLIIT